MDELPAAFVTVLNDHRDALNDRFAQRVRGGSRIDSADFLKHLRETIAPLIGQVHAALPERSTSVALALYDASLDLFSASLLGASAKMPWVRRAWTELLPLATVLLAREPQRVTGCLSNAVFQVASQHGARPEKWLSRMQKVIGHCQSVSELLEAGRIAAWQAGMVQYRRAALTAASQLRPELAARALGFPESTTPHEMPAVIDRLQKHVWLTAEAARAESRKAEIACVGTAGAFAGLGGLFFRPPVVRCDGQRIFVSDSKSQWELLADAYGSWFRRDESPVKQSRSVSQADASLDRQGTIRWANLSRAMPQLAHASSVITCGKTLAVTIPTSHHIFLFSNLSLPA